MVLKDGCGLADDWRGGGAGLEGWGGVGAGLDSAARLLAELAETQSELFTLSQELHYFVHLAMALLSFTTGEHSFLVL